MSVTYNYGGIDIDLADYIHNIGINSRAYMDRQKNWTQQQRQEFSDSLARYQEGLKEQLEKNNGRFSTDSNGTIRDRQGVMSNQDDDDIDPNSSQYYYNDKGERITTDDYNLLKKRKQKQYKTFNANQQVASYLDWIGQWTLKKLKENTKKKSNKFSLTNNGFEKYFYNQNQPNGGDFNVTPFLELDELQEDNTRGTAKRAEYLKNALSEYMKTLKEDDDYSETPFKDIETYKQRLQEAINSLTENGYNSQDNVALKRIGLSDKFLTNYFSTGQTEAPKSELEQQALQSQKNIQEREKNTKLQEIIDKDTQQAYELERKNYFDTFQKEHPFELVAPIQAAPLSYNLKGVNDYIRNNYKPENEEQFKQATIKYADIPQLVEYIKGKRKLIVNNKDTTAQHIANHLDYLAESNAYEDPKYLTAEKKSILGDYYVLPGSENYDDYTFIAYNPTTRQYQIQSMLANELLKEKMAYANYDKKNKKFQKGGNLQYWKEYENNKQEQQEEQKLIEQEAKETNKSVEQVKAGKRKPEELGFTGYDYTRMATAGADIASIIASYVPVYGQIASAGLGLTSTIGNFINNVAENGLDSQDWKDLGYGLAMDTAGIIPGVSTVKFAKVAKILKPLSKTILAGMSLYGLTKSAESTTKLFSNPASMTVDDWKNVLTGLQAIGGGTRMHSMRRNVKKQRGALEDVYSTKAKSGNDINLTKKQLDELKKLKGINAQNKYLKENGIQEELASEFRQGWDRVRHLGNPKVNKSTKMTNKDWFNEEYLPIDYKVVNNVVTPKWGTNAYWASLENNQNLSFKDWFFNKTHTKNPLFKSSPEAIQNTTPPKNSKKTNWELSEKRFNKAVEKAILNRDQVRTIEYWKNRYPKRLAGKSDKEIWNIIQEQQKLNKNKNGGILDRVRKFQAGTGKEGITNTTSTANWYEHMFNSPEFQNWVNTFDKTNYKKFNELQTSWNQNRINTGYDPTLKQVGPKSQDVLNRQVIWNETGTNPVIQRLVDQGLVTTYGNSGDNSGNNWQDGYFGNQEYLRHGGSSTSWQGKDAELKAFQDKLATKGLSYTLNNDTGMYELGLLETPKVGTPIKDNSVYTTVAEKETNDTSLWKDKWNKFQNNLILKYGIPRAIYADRINRKLTNIALENEKPNFHKPFQFHRYVTSDLGAEMQGVQSAAQLQNYAINNALTSDANQHQATVLESLLKGQQFINQGKAISDQKLEQSAELALQQNKENLKNAHDVAELNSQEASETAANKTRARMAYLAKKHNIWDNVWQQFEYDDKTKQLEKKNLEDSFAKQDIQNTIKYDLAELAKKQGIVLTPEQLNAWNLVASGAKTYSTLDSDEERKNWLEASKIAQQLQSNMLKDYYDISDTKWSKIRTFQKPEIEPIIKVGKDKKGGKIDTSKVRERIKNADRFQKSAEKSIDRNEKAIERMYKYKKKKK